MRKRVYRWISYLEGINGWVIVVLVMEKYIGEGRRVEIVRRGGGGERVI